MSTEFSIRISNPEAITQAIENALAGKTEETTAGGLSFSGSTGLHYAGNVNANSLRRELGILSRINALASGIIMDAEQAIFAPGGITPEERAIMQQTQAITGTIGLSLTTILGGAMGRAAAAG